MALISENLTAGVTELSVEFDSKLKKIALLSNDHASQSVSIAFGESTATADNVIVLAAEEALTNVFVGSAKTMYYVGSGAATGFRLIGESD